MPRPFRKAILILLIAGFLTAQPVKPAHAFIQAVLIAAVVFIGDQLLGLFTGDGKLKGMLLVLETELPIMLTTVEMKTNENIAKAAAAAHQEGLKHEHYKKSADEYPPDVLQANCQAMTPLADSARIQAKAQAVTQPLVAQELQHTGSSGGILGTKSSYGAGYSSHPQPNDPIAQIKTERHFHDCRYATENDLEELKQANCKDSGGNPITTLDQIKANPYKGADTSALSLLGTDAYYEDHAYLAAMDYCYTLTGNRPLSYAEGRALSEDLANIKNFLGTLSDKSARDLGAYSCAIMVVARMPPDATFANADKDLGRLLSGAQSANASGETRTQDQISATARTYLKEGMGYVELTQAEAKAKEEAHIRDPAHNPKPPPYVISDQQLPPQQVDLAAYVARWSSGKFINKQTGKPAQQYSLLLWPKVANLQLQWRQYQELERQVLTDAVELARMVRSAPAYGDPPPSASRQ